MQSISFDLSKVKPVFLNTHYVILWKDKLDPYIEKFSDGSERICVILIHLPKKTTCIIAAYMPSTGLKPSNDLYKKYLDEIGKDSAAITRSCVDVLRLSLCTTLMLCKISLFTVKS
jgi:hypothetical protein